MVHALGHVLPQPSSVIAITAYAFGPFSMKLMSRSNGSLSISVLVLD